MPDKHKTVIVLGAPRSGTSMTAGILDSLDVSMGNLRAADQLNPGGYFEDIDFLKLGDDIYSSVDNESHGFNPPAQSDLLSVGRKNFDTKVEQLLESRRLATRGHWGWKTTHTCYLLDLYLPHITDPHIVVVLRNPLNTARSMVRYVQHRAKRRMYQPLNVTQALGIIAGYESALYTSLAKNKHLPRIFLSFEEIVKAPRDSIAELIEFLDIAPDRKTQAKAVSFVDGGAYGFKFKKWIARKARIANRHALRS